MWRCVSDQNRVMAVYDRAVDKVEKKERYAVFNIYLKKAAEIYGVTKTRAIYEKVTWIRDKTVSLGLNGKSSTV